jgi:uncharacterized damage-inducible protein DinB
MIQDVQRVLERDLEGLAREVEMFPDDEILWKTARGVTNSAGNLARHVCGNLEHFVGAVLGGSGYVRQREAEFGVGSGTRAETAVELRETKAMVSRVLPTLSEEILAADFPDPPGGVPVSCRRFLLHLCTHLAFHLGQAGYLRRVVTGDARSSGPLSVRALNEA